LDDDTAIISTSLTQDLAASDQALWLL